MLVEEREEAVPGPTEVREGDGCVLRVGPAALHLDGAGLGACDFVQGKRTACAGRSNSGALSGEVELERVDEQRLYFYNSFCFLELRPSISKAISKPPISLVVFNERKKTQLRWLIGPLSLGSGFPFQQTSTGHCGEAACPRTAHPRCSQDQCQGAAFLFALHP